MGLLIPYNNLNIPFKSMQNTLSIIQKFIFGVTPNWSLYSETQVIFCPFAKKLIGSVRALEVHIFKDFKINF